MDRKEINSCLMLMADLKLPVSLDAILEDEDLKDTGIEHESHITLFYAKDRIIKPEEVESTKEIVVGKEENEYVPVLDLFELGQFNNDSDYLVLLLKKDTELFEKLSKTHLEKVQFLNIEENFSSYNPHMTLAELNPGSAEKYMNDEILEKVLSDSMVRFEDIVLSYGETGKTDYDKKNITTTYAVDRFFRLKEQNGSVV